MARRSASPLLLLLLLLVLLPLSERSCVASTTPAQLTSATVISLPDSIVRLLQTIISRAVRTSVGEVTSELEGRLSGLQVQLTQLAVTFSGLQSQQEAQNATLQRQLTRLAVTLAGLQSQQEAQNATHQRQLQAIETGVASVQSRLESRLEGVQAQVDSRLGDVQSRLEYKLSQIASRLPPRDCSDLLAFTESGIHHLLLPNLTQPVAAFCDQETDGGGWITFQRREDIKPRQDFFLGWEAYKRGFGAMEGEFWWGLEYLHLTTSVQLDRRYELRIDMEDFEGEKRFALYQDFRISSEADGYRLHVANYSGDASDSLLYHNGQAFSTKDKDQDTGSGHCAQTWKGAWWYSNCHYSNLNGPYLGGANTTFGQGINWHLWRGLTYSLKSVEMKMRPAKRAS